MHTIQHCRLVQHSYHAEATSTEFIVQADAIRLRLAPYDGAPHGYYVVPYHATGQAVFHFSQGDNIFLALENARRADSQHRPLETRYVPSGATPQTPRTSQVCLAILHTILICSD